VKLIHTSDWHIGGQAGEARQAEQLVRWLCAAIASERAALLISGDITDNGTLAQWEQVERLLAPLRDLPGLTLHLVPGNHDCGMHGINYDPARAALAARQCAALSAPTVEEQHGARVWELDDARLIGLDSQRGQGGEAIPPLARGELGTMQLLALDMLLGADDRPTWLALHHHPLWSDFAHELEDAAELRAVVARHPHVKGVLYGHRHVEGLRIKGGTRWIASGKTTAAQGGRLALRIIDTTFGGVQPVTLPMR
jgi:3',5'-cyclic-AMP phosphodiesterase